MLLYRITIFIYFQNLKYPIETHPGDSLKKLLLALLPLAWDEISQTPQFREPLFSIQNTNYQKLPVLDPQIKPCKLIEKPYKNPKTIPIEKRKETTRGGRSDDGKDVVPQLAGAGEEQTSSEHPVQAV